MNRQSDKIGTHPVAGWLRRPGLAAFVLLRRSVLAGTLVGAAALATLTALGGA